MKRFIIVLVLAALVAGGIFAQEKSANASPTKVGADNWVSLEGTIFGGGARYERMLNANLSLGVNVYTGILGTTDESMQGFTQGGDAYVRYYPWGKTFFAGAGLGFAKQTGSYETGKIGATVVPQLGWKIDVGDAGKFFIQPGLNVPVFLGIKTERKQNEAGVYENVKGFGVSAIIYPYFGMGFAF